MKKIITLSVFIFLGNLYAQVMGRVDSVAVTESSGEVLMYAEQMPEFPGGEEGVWKFLGDNLNYPDKARNKGIEGKVWTSFVIDKNGVVKDIEIVSGIGGGCDEEALRVLKLMPAWKPGIQNGIPVNVKFRFPINFALR